MHSNLQKQSVGYVSSGCLTHTFDKSLYIESDVIFVFLGHLGFVLYTGYVHPYDYIYHATSSHFLDSEMVVQNCP